MRSRACSASRRRALALAGALVFATAVTQAGTAMAQVAAGREIAKAKCQPCHGVDGIALTDDAPNLAGQRASYLRTQLFAFQKGLRDHEKMREMAQTMSRQEIFDVAEWYSAIKIEVTPPGE